MEREQSESPFMAVFPRGTNLACGGGFYGCRGTLAKSERDTKRLSIRIKETPRGRRETRCYVYLSNN